MKTYTISFRPSRYQYFRACLRRQIRKIKGLPVSSGPLKPFTHTFEMPETADEFDKLAGHSTSVFDALKEHSRIQNLLSEIRAESEAEYISRIWHEQENKSNGSQNK